MLVLSRQMNETICIGNDIKVMIVDIRGDKVRLGIDAPLSVAVHREEVLQRINAERARLTPVIVTPPGVKIGGGA